MQASPCPTPVPGVVARLCELIKKPLAALPYCDPGYCSSRLALHATATRCFGLLMFPLQILRRFSRSHTRR